MSTSIVERILAETRSRLEQKQAIRRLRQRLDQPVDSVAADPESAFIDAFLKRLDGYLAPVVTKVVSEQLSGALRPFQADVARAVQEELKRGGGGGGGASLTDHGSGEFQRETMKQLARLLDPEMEESESDHADVVDDDDFGFPIEELKEQLDNIMSDPDGDSSDLIPGLGGDLTGRPTEVFEDVGQPTEMLDAEPLADYSSMEDLAATQHISSETIDRAKKESKSDLAKLIPELGSYLGQEEDDADANDEVAPGEVAPGEVAPGDSPESKPEPNARSEEEPGVTASATEESAVDSGTQSPDAVDLQEDAEAGPEENRALGTVGDAAANETEPASEAGTAILEVRSEAGDANAAQATEASDPESPRADAAESPPAQEDSADPPAAAEDAGAESEEKREEETAAEAGEDGEAERPQTSEATDGDAVARDEAPDEAAEDPGEGSALIEDAPTVDGRDRGEPEERATENPEFSHGEADELDPPEAFSRPPIAEASELERLRDHVAVEPAPAPAPATTAVVEPRGEAELNAVAASIEQGQKLVLSKLEKMELAFSRRLEELEKRLQEAPHA